jgi:murein hydrolase activator
MRLIRAGWLLAALVWLPAGVGAQQKPADKAAKPAAGKPDSKPDGKADNRSDRQRELEALRGRMDKLKSEVDAAESQRSEAADALKGSERAISDTNRALFELTTAQRELAGELRQAAEQIEQVKAQVDQQRQRLAEFLVHQYQYGASDGLRLYLEGKDLAEAERQARYLEYISRERLALIGRFRQSIETLSQLEEALRTKQEALEKNLAEQKQARDKLESERTQKRKVLASLAGEISKNRKEMGRLKRDEDRLSKVIEQLGRILKPTQPAKPQPTPGGPRIEQEADPSLAGLEFASLKGKLRLPIRGELISRFGAPREGFSSKGLFIRGGSGQPVRVVGDGRVVFVDWMRSLGNFVVVDHGKDYLSIYGNVESVLKQVGDSVKSGDSIATTGDSGGAGESGVYFQLNHQGQPFDPLKWVKR